MSNYAGEQNLEKPKKVCILAYDGLCTFEYGIAVEVFSLPRPEIENWYQCTIVGIDPGEIRGMGNVVIDAPRDLSLLEGADLIVVPGWRGVNKPVPEALKQALLEASGRGTRIASICSGVFVLAECGLLGGRTVTTHWHYAKQLADMYPDVELNADVLYIDGGAVLTSAGSASGIDLCLHIVRKDFGAATANLVARRLVVPPHREGGQAQFISRPLTENPTGNIAPLLDEIRESLDEEWPIERMAGVAITSVRTLQRRFVAATGLSPHAWVTIERIELVKDILETTDLNIQQVALLTGLKTPETLRHHFKRLTGTSPTKFRSEFNARIS
jgi:AraC family transcriptional activator FtrA